MTDAHVGKTDVIVNLPSDMVKILERRGENYALDKIDTLCYYKIMDKKLKDKLFEFAKRQKMNHDTLAMCITVATGVKTSRSTVAAWARGARAIGAARAVVIKERMGL